MNSSFLIQLTQIRSRAEEEDPVNEKPGVGCEEKTWVLWGEKKKISAVSCGSRQHSEWERPSS